MVWGSGFRVQSLGFGVWGLGFRGLGFRVAALSSARRVASAKAASLCSLSMNARRSSLCGQTHLEHTVHAFGQKGNDAQIG